MAGLALSIQHARAGHRVILFERETYPFHKVCGEYISHESWNFLQDLGLPLSDLQLPQISRLQISAPDGDTINETLPLGGFGISRFLLEKMMADIAHNTGVTLMEGTKVMNTLYRNNRFLVFTDKGETEATLCAGSFGKRSNLDVKWKRNFTRLKPNLLNHYVGVKYHIRIDHPADLIALHNFDQGYCGISQVENNVCCLCYLTTAHNLRRNKNDIHEMEKNILMKNPFLQEIFSKAEFIWDDPITISRISFNKKSQVENHVLMVGDAAGMITPLCGNGMSMALHASKLAFEQGRDMLAGKQNRFEMEQQYSQLWEKHFGKRLMTGRILQRFFGNARMTNFLLRSVKPFPRFARTIISLTHGNPF